MLGLLDLAGMLNLVGVNTVHLTIARRPADDRTNPARQDFNAINASRPTRAAHCFASACKSATWLTPSAVIHLDIDTNEGRVRQAASTRCLP